MGFTYTPNFNLAKPDFGEPGTNWWTKVNANFDAIDLALISIGGSGAITSVFGRTGVITAQTGDYTATQVGAIPVVGGAVAGHIPIFSGSGVLSDSGVVFSRAAGSIYINDVTVQVTPVLPSNSAATNTANIASIIAAAADGTTLFFPEGTYAFAKNGGNDYAILINKRVNMLGEGWMGTKLTINTNDCHFIKVENPRRVGANQIGGVDETISDWGPRVAIKICELQLVRTALEAYQPNNTMNNYYSGLYLHGCAWSTFERLEFRNCGIAIHVYNGTGDLANGYFNVANDYRLIFGHFCRVGVKYTNGDTHQTDNRWSDILIIGDATYTTDGTGYNAGFWIEDAWAGDVMIRDSIFLRYEEGVHIVATAPNYSANVWLHDVWIDVFKNYGFNIANMNLISLSKCNPAAPLGTNSVGIYLANCHGGDITKCYIPITASGHMGIHVVASLTGGQSSYNLAFSQNTISGSTVVANQGIGFLSRGMSVSSIIGNNILGCSTGIKLASDSNSIPSVQNTIKGNTIHNQISGSNAIGIRFDDINQSNNIYQGNIAYLKVGGTPIQNYGTNNIIKDNQPYSGSASGTLRSATKIIAAHNSIDTTSADYMCDGTNDEVQVAQAVADLGTVGGEILFLEGNYYYSASVTVKSSITFKGVGSGYGWSPGSVNFYLMANVPMFYGDADLAPFIMNVNFVDINFAANVQTASEKPPTGTTARDVYLFQFINRCKEFSFTRCTFKYAGAIYIDTCWDFTFMNCTWHSYGSTSYPAIWLYNNYRVGLQNDAISNMHFIGCRWETGNNIAILQTSHASNPTQNAVGVDLVDCKVDSSNYAVMYGGFYGARITSSSFYNTTSGRSMFVFLSAGTKNTITGNIFEANAGAAIYFNCWAVTITGNVFSGAQTGLYIDTGTGAANSVISNNVFLTAQQGSINIKGGYIQIMGNVFNGSVATNDIRLESTSSYNFLIGNNGYSSTGGWSIYSDAGSNNKKHFNTGDGDL